MLDEAEHFPAQSRSQRRYAPMVFGIIPECRSASFRNKRSASPESPISAELTESYVDAALAGRMKEAVEAHEKAGNYDSIADGDVFAERLMEDLRAVSHDKHLRVDFSPFKIPDTKALSSEDIARDAETGEA